MDNNIVRLTIRLTAELHRALKVKCAMEGKEMTAVITEFLEKYVKDTKKEKTR